MCRYKIVGLMAIGWLVPLLAWSQHLTITEVMFDPVGADYCDEFIEIYNPDSSPVDLQGMMLEINGAIDYLDAPSAEWSLAPFSFGVIFDRGYLVERKSTTYESLVPVNVSRFTIKDASFGKSGLNNTTPNIIKLISADGDTLCTVVTHPDQPAGYSDEKILIEGPDSIENWGNSMVLYGTPGFRNSITPRDFDIAITTLRLEQTIQPIQPNQRLEFRIVVKNTGLNACDHFDIYFGEDLDNDNELAENELRFQSIGNLSVGDSITFTPSISDLPSGGHQFIACAIFPPDEYEANNQRTLPVAVAFPKGCLVINEFMYYPLNDGTGEWVELLNVSNLTVNLKNWTLGDQSSRAVLTKEDCYLPPQQYLVVANDSSLLKRWSVEGLLLDAYAPLPSLNNTGDSIVIRDLCGQVIDSLYYSSKWGYRQGVSLERKNPYRFSTLSSNWGLSKSEDGATPGAPNSILLKGFNLAIDSIAVCSDSQPLIQGATPTISVWLRNAGLDTVSAYTLQLRITRGSGPGEETIFNTHRINNKELAPYATRQELFPADPLPGGVFQVTASIDFAQDEDSTDNVSSTMLKVGFPSDLVIVNEIMYQPASGAPEWFELYNISNQVLDFNGWCFRKGKGSWLKICDTTYLLAPQEYLIVAAHSNFYLSFPEFDGKLICPLSFPTLNNTADSLLLRDAVGRVHELVRYDYHWGGKENVSVERLNPYQPAVTADNWGSSVAAAGATPGAMNSIARRTYDLVLDTIYTIPTRPLNHDDINLCVRIHNSGLDTLPNASVCIVVNTIRPTTTLRQFRLASPQSVPPDSFITLNCCLSNLAGGVYRLAAQIDCPLDQNPANDSASCLLKVGYAPGSMLITEILYKPEPNEVEWFEIYNVGPDTVNLQSWQFRNALSSWRTITDSTVYLAPAAFLVVAAQAKFLLRYPDFKGDFIIPAAFPNLNNTSDSLLLRDAAGFGVDAAYYRDLLGSKSGISIEKAKLTAPGTSLSSWQLSQAPIGATPGQRNSIQRWARDLALHSFDFLDTLNSLVLPANFRITIRNIGLDTINAFKIQLFEGKYNLNQIIFDQLVWLQSFNAPIAPDSEFTMAGYLSASRHGANLYQCNLLVENDENLDNNLMMGSLIVAFPPGVLTINEFLAYPTSNQVEFIELFNPSSLDLNLQGWQLSNHYKATTLPETCIKAGDYVVLTGDSAFFNYFDCPGRVVVLSKWPGLNNTADQIIIRDIAGSTIDSLSYDAEWQIAAGYSLEKILPHYNSSQKSSWQKCTNLVRATPGKPNSVTPYIYDVGLDSVRISASSGDTNTVFTAIFYYQNKGQQALANGALLIYHTHNDSTTFLMQRNLDLLAPTATGSVSLDLGSFPSGKHAFYAHLQWTNDQNPQNDTLRWTLQIAYKTNTLLLSEFMPYPFDLVRPDISNSEYIEIYNPANKSVDLSSWMLSDNNTGRKVIIPAQTKISPDGYLVLAADSSIFNFSSTSIYNTVVLSKFPALNNDEDEIYLYDPTGQVIDELHYFSTWSITKGYSLERVSWSSPNYKQNWRSCVATRGGTPGLPNSVALLQPLNKPGITATPPIFTPDGDKINDEVCLQYRLPYPSARLTLEIYNLEGRLVSRPARNLITASEGAIFWNGRDEQGALARIGLYLARCQASDLSSKQSVEYITSFVLFK